ncbi:hypothetical protein ABPG75_000090 [Micractinium tetrahymenae]
MQPSNIKVLGKFQSHEAPLFVSVRGSVTSDEPLQGHYSEEKAAILKGSEVLAIERLEIAGSSPARAGSMPALEGGAQLPPAAASLPVQEVGSAHTKVLTCKSVRLNRMLECQEQEAAWGLRDGSGAVLRDEGGLEAAEAGGALRTTCNDFIPSTHGGRSRLAEEELGERQLGVQVNEELLPLGEVITGVGMLHRKVDDVDSRQMLVLHPEILTRKPLQQLINEEEKNVEACERAAMFSWVMTAGLAVSALSALHKESLPDSGKRWR